MALTIAEKGAHRKLCIGMLPGRKRPSLYFWTALDIRVLASFRDEGAARDLERFFERMAHKESALRWDTEDEMSEHESTIHDLQAELDRLATENVRLRKALERLSAWLPVGETEYKVDLNDPCAKEIRDRIKVARQALTGEKK